MNKKTLNPFITGLIIGVILTAIFGICYHIASAKNQPAPQPQQTRIITQQQPQTNKSKVKYNKNGGTVTVMNPANTRTNTYSNAHVTLIGSQNNNSTNQLIITTKSGNNIRPSDQAQVTYPKSAINY